MSRLIKPILPGFFAAIAALALAGAVVAQDAGEPPAEEDAIAPIVLDRGTDRTDVPDADEGFEDVVYDEASRSYRLIEEDGGDDWVEGRSEQELQIEELTRLFELYREALKNKDYLEADTLAKRVVELSIKVNGLDSHDSAKAITNLGIAQHNNGDFESAMRNFIASIDIIERIDDNLSPELINPLQGLAATQAAIGRPDLARLSYQRAVHVSHVNEGPHNPEQVAILESMAELHLSQGDVDDAVDIQEHIFSIQSRKIDPDSLEIIPALEQRAEWQHRLQSYHRERMTWRQIIDILEDNYGKDALQLIPPLTSLGKSYLFISPAELEYAPEVSAASGEAYLRRANRIAAENPESDWRLLGDSLLALSDYYVLSGRANRAAQTMAEAWLLLSEGEDPKRLDVRKEDLEDVVLLQKVYPPRYYNSEREDTGQPPPD
ncbi:MAG: tetratricopeptide repeat protein, partial [Gammaproteobacteria bacterium]|nr:tetratricopeptide repeat protein [Gammaproteobacteria bacterium]